MEIFNLLRETTLETDVASLVVGCFLLNLVGSPSFLAFGFSV